MKNSMYLNKKVNQDQSYPGINSDSDKSPFLVWERLAPTLAAESLLRQGLCWPLNVLGDVSAVPTASGGLEPLFSYTVHPNHAHLNVSVSLWGVQGVCMLRQCVALYWANNEHSSSISHTQIDIINVMWYGQWQSNIGPSKGKIMDSKLNIVKALYI